MSKSKLSKFKLGFELDITWDEARKRYTSENSNG